MKKIFTLLAVAAMAFASQANQLTICDGGAEGYYSSGVPIYGLWVDTEGTIGQVLYQAELLQDMVGCEISEVKFYTTAYYYENYSENPSTSASDFINFENATIQLALKVVEENSIETAIEGAEIVATTVPEKGSPNMTFTLEQPFVYEGGNLLVECKVIEVGTYGTTYFFGSGTEEENAPNTAYYGYDFYGDWSEAAFAFQPMVSFVYEPATAEPVICVVGFNDWENPIEITEEGATVEVQEQNFNDPQDTAQEFKLITTDDNGEPVYFGGIDENQVGFFWIDNTMLGQPITLDDEGSNFRLPEPGNYTIKIVKDETKAPVEGIQMVVTKNAATAIESINSDMKGDNTYYNLMGQKFTGNNLPAGIYIHNGKKIIVR